MLRLLPVALLSVSALLAGCASEAGPQALPHPADVPPPGAAPEQGTIVEAVRVRPHVFPVDLVGHNRPAPCVGLARPCEFGASVQAPFQPPPGQPGNLSAGVEWSRLAEAFTDPDGLFWRIRLSGDWSSSTPAVDGVRLAVGTVAATCDGCEPRIVLEQQFTEAAIDLERTDVFLKDGEDTLVFWVEPLAVGPTGTRPADDVQVTLRGWAAAFVADGEPIRLSSA